MALGFWLQARRKSRLQPYLLHRRTTGYTVVPLHGGAAVENGCVAVEHGGAAVKHGGAAVAVRGGGT